MNTQHLFSRLATYYSLLLISVATTPLFGQKVVVEKTITSDLKPLSYHYSKQSDRLFVEEGTFKKGLSTNNHIKALTRYQSDGQSDVFFNDGNYMMSDYSYTGNTVMLGEFISMSYYADKYEFVTDKGSTGLISTDKYSSLDKTSHFNDQFAWGLSHTPIKKKSKAFNLLKNDELYLIKFDYQTKKGSSVKLETPDTDRLTKKGSVKFYKNKLAFINDQLVPNDTHFDVITKRISKDYKQVDVYRTVYDFQGKKVDDIHYQVELPKGAMIYSNNAHAKLTMGDYGKAIFDNNLCINAMKVDPQTKEVYIYGLYSSSDKYINFPINPKGVYLAKFDAKGKKIWQVNKSVNNDLFNKKNRLQNHFIDLVIEKDVVFLTNEFSLRSKRGVITQVIDSESGKDVNKQTKDAKRKRMLGSINQLELEYFLYAFNGLDAYKGKRFDDQTLVLLGKHQKMTKYIDAVSTNSKEVFFNSIYSVNGYWLIESDNKTYYKVLFFNK